MNSDHTLKYAALGSVFLLVSGYLIYSLSSQTKSDSKPEQQTTPVPIKTE
jgi:hypothetical protein